MLRFIYDTIKHFLVFALACCNEIEAYLGFIKPKWGGVVSTFSLPSTNFCPQTFVHKLLSTNFCPQTSVHKLLSTNFRRHLVPHNTHSLLACARMNELKTLWLYARQLNARQSENFTEFSLKAFFKLLESINCFLSHVKRL